MPAARRKRLRCLRSDRYPQAAIQEFGALSKRSAPGGVGVSIENLKLLASQQGSTVLIVDRINFKVVRAVSKTEFQIKRRFMPERTTKQCWTK